MSDALRRQANSLLAGFMKEMQQMEINRIKASPEKHKTTLIMEGNSGYRYWPAGENKRARYSYCVSNYVNVAGYFLVWREVRLKKEGKHKGHKCTGWRDQWVAKKSASAAVKIAQRRAEKHKERLAS